MNEQPLTIHGVPGILKLVRKNDDLWRVQSWISERRVSKDAHGGKILIHATLRFDDECGNGHNSFAITGHGWYDHFKARDWDFGGCCHAEIAKAFPELAHLIKWHLVDAKRPMHYVANAVYHASDRDSRGYRKGEPCSWDWKIKFGSFPIPFAVRRGFREWLKAALGFNAETPKSNPNRPSFEILEVPYVGTGHNFSPKYSFVGYDAKWHECPFDTRAEAEQFREALGWGEVTFVRIVTGYSEGKERQLDYARSAAVWPEATDEQLRLPKEELTKLLEARLPGLMADFRADIEAAGFAWQPPAQEAVA